MSKKVSIIVPCYNVEQYLPRCLESLVHQTLDNIEIICINDGSPDGCINILRKYESCYPDKIIIIDKNNEGVWRGRWDGIAIARGEYIGFLDSDDYAEPNFIEDLYTAAKKCDADLAVGGFSRIDIASGKKMSHEMCSLRSSFNVKNEPGRLIELNGAPWNKLFHAGILKTMHDLQKPPAVLDDLLFHLLAYLNTNGNVVFVPRSLVNYVVRSDSIINTITQEKLQTGYDAFLEVKHLYQVEHANTELIQALDTIAFLHLGISMSFRLSYDKAINLNDSISYTTQYLNENFPSWNRSPYTTFKYAKQHRGAFTKLAIAKRIYSSGLMQPFLAAYRFMIHRFKTDIKW